MIIMLLALYYPKCCGMRLFSKQAQSKQRRQISPESMNFVPPTMLNLLARCISQVISSGKYAHHGLNYCCYLNLCLYDMLEQEIAKLLGSLSISEPHRYSRWSLERVSWVPHWRCNFDTRLIYASLKISKIQMMLIAHTSTSLSFH